MKTIKLFLASVFLAGAVAGTAACGGNEVAELEKLADEMCACKDMDCAKKVEEKLSKLEGKEPDKYSEEDQKKIMAAAMKVASCQAKLQGAGGAEAPAGE
ncbi:MAG TPA: hypothetical protein VKZ63_17665 [Kofleriaceae bacterium]|nr:hypothetical protein [Kofleriaceae bacterium]